MSYLQTQIENLIRLAQETKSVEPYNEITQWVATDGTQYIDTGFIADQNSKIEIGFNILDTGTAVKAIFGSRNWNGSTVSQAFYFYKTNSAIVQVGWGNQSKNITLGNATELQAPMRLIIDKGSVTLVTSANTYTETFTSTTFETSTSLVIGTCRTGVTGTELDNRPVGVDVRYCKLWNNGTPAYNYYPALNSKMQPCLYDKVTKTFTYAYKLSDGTETYDLGFKRWNKYDVDYIESSGTQYIDTGYAFADDFAYEVEYEGLNNGECLLGGRTSSVRTAILYRAMATQVDGQTTVPIAGLNATQTPFKLGVLSDTKHKVKVAIANNTGNVWVDDTQVYTNQSFTGTYISGKTTAIFADHFGDLTGTNEYQEYATSKLYMLKFWQGTTLVRDFKPSVRTYNDGTGVVTKAFLYDEVYNKAYDNAGTGSFKAYIEADREVYNLSMHDTMDTDGFYLAEDGTKTVSSDGTSCYTNAIQVKQGDIIEWTVTAEAVTANKRIHGYSTDADITTGQKGSWVEMLAKIVFSTTSDTTQTASFVVPSGVNYIRLSHANTREMKDSIVRIRTYEVGKAIRYPQNNGFTLDAPKSSNFILDLLTRATTTGSYYILDTRNQTSSSSEDEFGIGGSSSGATVNWKCESESQLVATNGTNWQRNSNYTYSQLLVGYKEGNTFKRTASFYDFNNQKTSDVTVVTATRDIANNTKPLTILHTTSSNWLQNGADVHYFKYLQDDNDVWYDCIPVRNATLTSSVLLFDRVNNTSLPNTGSGTPTFVALD